MKAQERRRVCAALFVSAAVLAPAVTAFAQEGGGTIEEVVVTARKRAENLQEIPVAVTAVSGESIKAQSIESIREVANQTPSLAISQGSAGRASVVVTIRGQTNNDLLLTVDPAVGIYIDGVNVAKTITGELANLLDVERVEVLKGPQGTLYGRNTTGGSINIFSKLPGADPMGQVSLRGGSFNRRGGTLIFNMPIKGDDVALRVAGMYDKRDGMGDNIGLGKKVGGDMNGGSLRATLRVRPTDSVEFLLRGDYTASTTSSIAQKPRGLITGSTAATIVGQRIGLTAAQAATPAGRAQAAAAYANQVAGLGFWDSNSTYGNSDDVYSWGTSGTLTVDLPADLQFKSISAYRAADRQTFYDQDGTPFSLLHTNGYTHQEVLSQELQLSGVMFDERLNWIAGGYYSREFGFDGTQSVSLGSEATRSFNEGHVRNKSLAGFGQATFDITDRLSITGGLRYTEEDKRLVSGNRRLDGLCNLPTSLRLPGTCIVIRYDKWDAWNYTASIDFKPVDGMLVYAKTGTGFRSGGHNLRGGVDPTTFLTFNPERVKDYELGLKADWFDRRVRTNLAVYRTNYKNIQRIVLVPSTLNPSSTVVRNAARAVVKGAEAEVTIVPIENLTLKATGGLTDPKYKEYRDGFGVDLSSFPFVYIPKKTYSLSANYTHPMDWGKVTAQVDWAYRGRVYYDDDSLFNGTNGYPDFRYQSGFGLLNGRVGFTFDDPQMEVAFFAKNITNKRYIAYELDLTSTAIGFMSYVPGDRRTWGFEVTKTFQ